MSSTLRSRLEDLRVKYARVFKVPLTDVRGEINIAVDGHEYGEIYAVGHSTPIWTTGQLKS